MSMKYKKGEFCLDKVQAFITSIPYIKELLTEDTMITVFDHEKYLYYSPSTELDFGHKPGESLPDGYLNYAMVDRGGTTTLKVPKEEFGVPFTSISFPIKDDKGDIVAAVNAAVSTTRQEMFKNIIDSMDMVADSLLGKVQHIAAHSEELSTTAEQIQKNTEKTVEHSSEVTHVTNTIKGISEQTNLLGLNAAIEAARVGNEGAGFGVVASEVRKLSLDSKNATETIEETLNAIQNSIHSLQNDFQEITKSSQEEAQLVSEFMNEIETLNETSNKLKSFMETNFN